MKKVMMMVAIAGLALGALAETKSFSGVLKGPSIDGYLRVECDNGEQVNLGRLPASVLGDIQLGDSVTGEVEGGAHPNRAGIFNGKIILSIQKN
jgi:hypothetical protein